MILTRLRERTHEAHGRVEARVNLFDQTATLADYRKSLTRFYGFYKPIESQIADSLARSLSDFDFNARRKTCLLEKDLRAFGVFPEQMVAFPQCDDLPPLQTAGQVLGCLYVLEGATLGGQIISRHLLLTHGLDATNGAAFFNGYGSENGRMWRDFGTALREFAKEDAENEDILQSAERTFAAFEAWFAQGENGHE